MGVSPRQSATMRKRGIVPSTPPNHPSPPIVPQRVSAYLQNCTVPDDYLLKQGKRLSQMLNLTPKKEEKHTFRSLHAAFSKVGTLLKKGRSPSLAENTPQFSPSPTKTKKPLGFPDTPTWKADRQYDIAVLAPIPPKEPEYLEIVADQTQFSPSPMKTKKPLGFPDTPTWKADRQYDIAVLAPIPPKEPEYLEIVADQTQFSPSPMKTKKPLGFPDTPTWKADRQYDIAVLAPIPPKEPEYLEIVADQTANNDGQR